MQRTSLVGIMCALLVSGCALEVSEVPHIASHAQALSDENQLSTNRLSANRLSLNRLSLNRLSLNRLSLNRLQLNTGASDGLETTPEGRELLTYIAKCALVSADILVAEHDGVTYEFPGLLGVAPEWEHEPLSLSLQRWVSACLLAHVNAFGVSVPISLRAHDKLSADADEIAEFPVYEATFFGNVFDGEQDMYACTGDRPDIAAAQSPSRALRVCSDPSGDGTSECTFTTLGRCRDVCTEKHARMGWSGCAAGGTTYTEGVSVHLRVEVDEGASVSCPPGERCRFVSRPAQIGNVQCTEADRCDTTLLSSSVYKVDCTDADQCSSTCVNDTMCEVDCAGTGRCKNLCVAGSDCEIECHGADRCDKLICTGGSRCLVHCGDAESCDFQVCTGEVRHCPGNILVCNGECPEAPAATP